MTSASRLRPFPNSLFVDVKWADWVFGRDTWLARDLEQAIIDRFQRAEHERPTVGIILCSEKNDAAARITLPEDNEQILAARHQRCLPTQEELRLEVTRSGAEVEHRLLL